jgi:hypothetical protein
MRTTWVTAVIVAAAVIARGDSSEEELRVRDAVAAFYADLHDRGFDRADRYATLDWTHIDATGKRARGREAALSELRKPQPALTAQETTVRFVTDDVALATVVDAASPGGARSIRTLVLLKQKGRWRITQDQATPLGG